MPEPEVLELAWRLIQARLELEWTNALGAARRERDNLRSQLLELQAMAPALDMADHADQADHMQEDDVDGLVFDEDDPPWNGDEDDDMVCSACSAEEADAEEAVETLCGFLGCLLSDNHAGEHQHPPLLAQRTRRQADPYSWQRAFGFVPDLGRAARADPSAPDRPLPAAATPHAGAAANAANAANADAAAAATDDGGPWAYDGTDEEGGTDAAAVRALQADFRDFCGVCDDEESVGDTLYRRWVKARTEANEPEIDRSSLDSRLSFERQCRTWGLTAKEAQHGNSGLHAKEKLEKLVSRDPTCLFDHPDDEDDRPRGEYFWPIDQAWMDACDWAGDWKRTLCKILTDRMTGLQQQDGDSLIMGRRVCPQPSGRYVSKPDLIRMWNESRGICKCGRHIWLGLDVANDALHGDICDKENCSGMNSHRACVGRTDAACLGHEIHLHRNILPCMICAHCSGKEGNPRRWNATRT